MEPKEHGVEDYYMNSNTVGELIQALQKFPQYSTFNIILSSESKLIGINDDGWFVRVDHIHATDCVDLNGGCLLMLKDDKQLDATPTGDEPKPVPSRPK